MRSREGRRAGAREGACGTLPWGGVAAAHWDSPHEHLRETEVHTPTLSERQERRADIDLATSKLRHSGPSQTQEDKACGTRALGATEAPEPKGSSLPVCGKTSQVAGTHRGGRAEWGQTPETLRVLRRGRGGEEPGRGDQGVREEGDSSREERVLRAPGVGVRGGGPAGQAL